MFLLSRIRERYDATRDTHEAVRWGVASTARIITGAALIIVAVSRVCTVGTSSCSSRWGSGSPCRC